MRSLFVLCLTLAVAPFANAYTGPGLGLGVIGTVVGVLFSLVLAVLAIFWYPLKRVLKICQKKTKAKADEDISAEKLQAATENVADPK